MKTSLIEDAKHCLRIPDLWRHFGFPGVPKTSCRCPWREDHHASFSVSADGRLWNDFGANEGGDAIDFLARASGLGRKEACRKFIELAGSHIPPNPVGTHTPRKRPSFPLLERGTTNENTQLATLRNIGPDGLELASKLGLLWFASLHGVRAWIVTDKERLNAQARRMDGGFWEHLDGRPKVWTLPGSHAAWPLGVREATDFPCLALCEGGPDLLAAFHFIFCEARERDCTAVTILGASLSIHPEALSLFAGKRVRIFGHADADGKGARAVERWAGQLTRTGAEVDAFNFAALRKIDGSPIKDLNDCTSVHADDFEENRELWGVLP
jgi:hypothetical protein